VLWHWYSVRLLNVDLVCKRADWRIEHARKVDELACFCGADAAYAGDVRWVLSSGGEMLSGCSGADEIVDACGDGLEADLGCYWRWKSRGGYSVTEPQYSTMAACMVLVNWMITYRDGQI
jgi:hypothetical protein